MATKDSIIPTTPFELADGQVVPLVLTYRLLLALRAKDKAAYKAYNDARNKRSVDDVDILDYEISTLYAAYLCGVLAVDGDMDDAMGRNEFIDALPYDEREIGQAVSALTAPKARVASEEPSTAAARGGDVDRG